ncbi:MAG: hypothetical protein FWE85_02595, partial [Clostridiales bacterium]|nr:hypothetical protein [Clostridiales bacterium]
GSPVQEYDRKFVLEYECGAGGVGYGFKAPLEEDITGIVTVYYLSEKNAKDAKDAPYRYYNGKNLGTTPKQAAKTGWQEEKVVIGGHETTAYWKPLQENTSTEWLTFVYEEKFIITMYFFKNEEGLGCLDFAKDLAFELINLNP